MRVLVHHLAQRMGMPERSAPGGEACGGGGGGTRVDVPPFNIN